MSWGAVYGRLLAFVPIGPVDLPMPEKTHGRALRNRRGDGSLFELLRRFVAERRMEPHAIVVAVDERCDVLSQVIVPVVNVEPNENMEFACPPSIPPFGGQRTSCVGRRRVGGLQIPSHAPFGEPRATAPTRRPASLGEAA